MRRILAKCHVLLALAATTWVAAAAPALAKSEIEISAHSQTDFAVYKGDELNLSLSAKGDNLEYKWIRSKETFCREAVCKVDTGDWGLGTHRVVVVVLNAKGSLFLRYNIRILATPAGYKPGKVTPPLVEAGEGFEQISADDYTVRMVQGRGYSYHKKKVQVVGPLPRAAEWSEKLKTKASGIMRLSRDNAESHVLAPSSSVQLAQSKNGRRALQLKAGTIRSRNLSGKDPRWSIVVGDWLQVDTDVLGDVLVTRVDPKDHPTKPAEVKAEEGEEEAPEAEEEQPAGEQVKVMVLRGAARVYQSKDGANAGEAVVVPQGSEVTLTKGGAGPFVLTQPDPARIASLFGQTTPEYLLGQKPVDEGKGLTILQGKTVKTVKNATELATSANGQHDYMVTIEAFSLVLGDVKGNAVANGLLGDACRGLYLYESALPAYKAAAEADDVTPLPHFGMGMIELHRKNWAQAIKHFEDAEDRGYEDTQALNYYLGVAKFNADNPVGAKSAFTYSLWEPNDADVEASARKFYDRLKTDGWLDLRFGAGIFYDSNVLRAGGGLDLTLLAGGKIEKTKSLGYQGSAGFTLWPARSEAFQFYFGFDAEKNGYLEKSLADLALLDQKLILGFGIGLGGEAGEKRIVALKVDGQARTVALGEERSMDMLGGRFALGSPRLLDLFLRVESLTAIDPLPARDDVLDPLREEVVAAGDRSVQISYYGLGLKPVDGSLVHLGLDLKSGGGKYKTSLHQDENFKDAQVRIDLALTTSLRNELDFGIQQLKRTYQDSEDDRKDSQLAVDLGWKWYYTTVLYHRLTVGNEAQTSSRDLNTYKRQTFMYKLNLDF